MFGKGGKLPASSLNVLTGENSIIVLPSLHLIGECSLILEVLTYGGWGGGELL